MLLEASRLAKSYGTVAALREFSLGVEGGEIVGLLGPNGAGKTTAVSIIAGAIEPDRGRVVVNGFDLRRRPVRAKACLAFVPQELGVYPMLSARRNLRFVAQLYCLPDTRRRVDEALDLAGLRDRAAEPVRRFSTGMTRRLSLAMGILPRPPLLVLDEPTAGVDPQSRLHIRRLLEELAAEGTAILYTTHHMEEAEALCRRVAVMDHGRILTEGSIGEIVRRHGVGCVEIELDGGESGLALALGILGGLPGLVRVEPAAPYVRIAVKEARGSASAALRALERGGVAVRSFRAAEPSLETAFLALTGHELRD